MGRQTPRQKPSKPAKYGAEGKQTPGPSFPIVDSHVSLKCDFYSKLSSLFGYIFDGLQLDKLESQGANSNVYVTPKPKKLGEKQYLVKIIDKEKQNFEYDSNYGVIVMTYHEQTQSPVDKNAKDVKRVNDALLRLGIVQEDTQKNNYIFDSSNKLMAIDFGHVSYDGTGLDSLVDGQVAQKLVKLEEETARERRVDPNDPTEFFRSVKREALIQTLAHQHGLSPQVHTYFTISLDRSEYKVPKKNFTDEEREVLFELFAEMQDLRKDEKIRFILEDECLSYRMPEGQRTIPVSFDMMIEQQRDASMTGDPYLENFSFNFEGDDTFTITSGDTTVSLARTGPMSKRGK